MGNRHLNIEEQAEEQSFGELFVALQAGMFDCVPVTSEMKELGHPSQQLVLAVCSLFGVYIKFSVHSTASMGTETVARPAVEVMRNAQRQ